MKEVYLINIYKSLITKQIRTVAVYYTVIDCIVKIGLSFVIGYFLHKGLELDFHSMVLSVLIGFYVLKSFVDAIKTTFLFVYPAKLTFKE